MVLVWYHIWTVSRKGMSGETLDCGWAWSIPLSNFVSIFDIDRLEEVVDEKPALVVVTASIHVDRSGMRSAIIPVSRLSSSA